MFAVVNKGNVTVKTLKTLAEAKEYARFLNNYFPTRKYRVKNER